MFRFPIPTSQWLHRLGYLRRLNVLSAWQFTQGEGAKLGHVDTGINLALPEFSGRSIETWNLTTSPASAAMSSGDGHGNRTGAILTGKGGAGLLGVAPAAPYIHVKYALADAADDTADAFAAGVIEAATRGARVICGPNSWAAPTSALTSAVSQVEALGAVLVTTAGNLGVSVPRYPAALGQVVGVGGTLMTDDIWGAQDRQNWGIGSNYGAHIRIAAPSYNIFSYSAGMAAHTPSDAGGIYDFWNIGTSYGCPMVAGVAHLIASANPALTAAQIRSILFACADRPRVTWLYSAFFPNGYGIPDAEKSVVCALSLRAENAETCLPYLRVHSLSDSIIPEDTQLEEDAMPGVRHEVSGGWCEVVQTGAVGLELTSFYRGSPTGIIELWIDGVLKYSGSPTSRVFGNLFVLNDRKQKLRELRLVGRTGTGVEGERTYLTAFDSNEALGVRMEEYALPPQIALSGAASAHAAATAGARIGLPAGSAGGDAEGQGALTIQPPLIAGAGGQSAVAGTLSQIEKHPARVFEIVVGDAVVCSFGARPWTVQAQDGSALSFGLAPSGYLGPAVDLAGGASGHAGATAILGVMQGLVGSAAGHAGASAAATDQGIGGTAAGTAGAQATISQAQALAGEATASAGAVATGPQLPLPLSGLAEGQGGATGVEGNVPLAGKTAGSAGGLGTLSQAQALSGSAEAHAEARVGSGLAPFVELHPGPVTWGIRPKSVRFGLAPRATNHGIRGKRP